MNQAPIPNQTLDPIKTIDTELQTYNVTGILIGSALQKIWLDTNIQYQSRNNPHTDIAITKEIPNEIQERLDLPNKTNTWTKEYHYGKKRWTNDKDQLLPYKIKHETKTSGLYIPQPSHLEEMANNSLHKQTKADPKDSEKKIDIQPIADPTKMEYFTDNSKVNIASQKSLHIQPIGTPFYEEGEPLNDSPEDVPMIE